MQIFLDSFSSEEVGGIGPLHNPVTRYKITFAGEQVAQWHFQNNATCTSPTGPAFVLEVLLHNLLTGKCDFVRCDQIVQRLYQEKHKFQSDQLTHIGGALVFMLIKRLVGVLLLSLNKMLVN